MKNSILIPVSPQKDKISCWASIIIEALCFYANRTNLFVGGLQKNKNRLQWSQQLILSVCKDARGSEGMDKRSAVNPLDKTTKPLR